MIWRGLRLWGPVAAYMAGIFWVSSLTRLPIPLDQRLADKLAHVLEYFVLSLLIVRALTGGLPARIDMRTIAVASVIAWVYAASDEVHQLFVPNRSAEFLDWIADATGAVCGAFICRAWGIIAARPARDIAP